MNLLFPQLYQLACGIWHEESEESVVLQKQILKIFFSFTQVNSRMSPLCSSYFIAFEILVHIAAGVNFQAVFPTMDGPCSSNCG